MVGVLAIAGLAIGAAGAVAAAEAEEEKKRAKRRAALADKALDAADRRLHLALSASEEARLDGERAGEKLVSPPAPSDRPCPDEVIAAAKPAADLQAAIDAMTSAALGLDATWEAWPESDGPLKWTEGYVRARERAVSFERARARSERQFCQTKLALLRVYWLSCPVIQSREAALAELDAAVGAWEVCVSEAQTMLSIPSGEQAIRKARATLCSAYWQLEREQERVVALEDAIAVLAGADAADRYLVDSVAGEAEARAKVQRVTVHLLDSLRPKSVSSSPPTSTAAGRGDWTDRFPRTVQDPPAYADAGSRPLWGFPDRHDWLNEAGPG